MSVFKVEITDEVMAETATEAVASTLDRICNEETIAKVVNLGTGKTVYLECHTGDSLEDLLN